ncbi:MAG: hypothetical protein DRI26_02975 [Chloroflexi bacterium]|nr:MAG: hypothetical protein DRI26_02975 [Chloroflexota bacterium]
MEPTEYPEHLLKVFFNEYNRNSVVREYGLYPNELINKSRIRFPDYGDALAAVDRMRELGWIKVLSPRPARRVCSFDGVQLTEKGIHYAQWLLRPWHRKAWDTVKGYVRSRIHLILAVLLTLLFAYLVWRFG